MTEISEKDKIASVLSGVGYVGLWAEEIMSALSKAGYRILGPGEIDAETLERAAQVAESTPAYGDPVEISVGLGPVGERIATAIRKLKSKDQ